MNSIVERYGQPVGTVGMGTVDDEGRHRRRRSFTLEATCSRSLGPHKNCDLTLRPIWSSGGDLEGFMDC
jgi:hypothetical protein